MERPLAPLPNWTLRVVLCAVFAVLPMLSSGPWTVKVFSVAFAAAMTGTTRRSRVIGAEFEAQMFVAFVPLKAERCKLKVVTQIETSLLQETQVIDWVLFAGVTWVTERLMKWVWPWISGDFELWLITAREKRILAWRGNGDTVFQDNLAVLMSATGAEVRRQ